MAYINVEIDLIDIDTDDLMSELQSRGADIKGQEYFIEKLQHIYELRKLNKPHEKKLDEYLYIVLGKIV